MTPEKPLNGWLKTLLAAFLGGVLAAAGTLITTGQYKERVDQNREILKRVMENQDQIIRFMGAQTEINGNVRDNLHALQNRLNNHIDVASRPSRTRKPSDSEP